MDKLINLLITDIPETLEKGETEIILWGYHVHKGILSTEVFENLAKDNYFDN
jgi:hypothetical protein